MSTPNSGRARVVLAGALIAAALVLAFTAGKRAQPAPQLAANERLADTAVVLVAVRGLARLEGVAFHMERIIDLKQTQPRLFGLVESDDEILLVAAGDVIAGVDLAKMRDGDVIAEPDQHRARMVLPAPELLSVRLDNARTYVHTRKTGLLAKRGDNLETRARQLAEQSIGDAALSAGILDRAKQSAEQTLSTLVRSLGYDKVEITWAKD